MKNLLLILSVAFLLSCFQGPWEYTPDVTEPFRGITANAYVVADRKIEDVCFEPIMDLETTYTKGFNFYTKARIEISGESGSGVQTVELAEKPGVRNCFVGPDDFIPQKGATYQLQATITWDSAGVEVTSVITGSTKIPSRWGIGDTATANSMALAMVNVNVPRGTDGFLSILAGLPEEVQMDLLDIWGSKYLLAEGKDNEKNSLLEAELIEEKFVVLFPYTEALTLWGQDSARQIQEDVDSLLLIYTEWVPYENGDTIAYLTGALNTTSHYFQSDYSDDVAGVLITQRFQENAIIGETRFDEITKQFRPLEVQDLHSESIFGRLIYYNSYGDETSNVMDSLAVVNSWLKGGKNVFYFYAVEKNYSDFLMTYVENADNPKVKKKHSVQGGHGYFAGAVIDSFTIYGVIPNNIISYNRLETKLAYCAEAGKEDEGGALKGWFAEPACWKYAPTYCAEANYRDIEYQNENPEIYKKPALRNDCVAESVVRSLKEGLNPRHYLEEAGLPGATFTPNEYEEFNFSGIPAEEGAVTEAPSKETEEIAKPKGGSVTFDEAFMEDKIEQGIRWYCIQTGFENVGQCAKFKTECYESQTPQCYELLMDFCEENLWEAPGCEEARVKKCMDPAVKSNVLCKGVRG